MENKNEDEFVDLSRDQFPLCRACVAGGCFNTVIDRFLPCDKHSSVRVLMMVGPEKIDSWTSQGSFRVGASGWPLFSYWVLAVR